jgi:hypothetical protein
MRMRITRWLVRLSKLLRLQKLLNVPTKFTDVRSWVKQHEKEGARVILLKAQETVRETPPVIVGYHVSARFTKYYERKTREAFVAVIPNGHVLGEATNFIITPDNIVLADVSREFGAEGGRKPEAFSVFHDRLGLPAVQKVDATIAVVSTCGSNNFHHWNYDILPRLQLLKQSALFDKIDQFVVNYQQLKFQLVGLELMGIDKNKIINSHGNAAFHLTATTLVVPSLTEDLGTITPWVLDFMRSNFLPQPLPSLPTGFEKLYISRRTVAVRKMVNEADVMKEIFARGYREFIPEDYTLQEAAAHFASARSIVSVHGSGLSNLPFISEGTKVLDILAPLHQDGYYWMICNQRKSLYVGLFAEGEHPADDEDLVKNKVDHDLLIDINKLKQALDLVS